MNLRASSDFELDFIPPGTMMLAEVITRLQADTDLCETRRCDFVSGLRRIAKALGRPPEDIPCDTRWLQKRLEKISPAAIGVAPKTWQNAVSDARSAMAHVGVVDRKISSIDDLTPEWRRLWALVLESKDRTLTASLRRFVQFLSCRGILPDQVRQEHTVDFLRALEANEIRKNPGPAYRNAVNAWKLAGQRIRPRIPGANAANPVEHTARHIPAFLSAILSPR